MEQTFDVLQSRLVRLWEGMGTSRKGESVVVVPSMTLDNLEERGSEVQAYEERFLFLLLLLRQPNLRVIYVSSQMINPSVIDYYLGLLPGVIPSQARRRLFLVSPLDGSAQPLSLKLLQRPRILQQIRDLIPDPELSHLIPYNTTELERDLAVELGIPMYGADPRFFELGTKSGCRRLFAEEGVQHPMGRQDLTSLDGATDAIADMLATRPMEQVLVKLNEGVSGEGNAVVDLKDVPSSDSQAQRDAIDQALRKMQFELASTTFDSYVAKLKKRGGIVEERILGSEIRSPSVQLRVTPLGDVELLSTHDQLLGGPSGQSYLGCRFPADAAYASQITAEAAKVGTRLAREGVIGRFALDFVVVKQGSDWAHYAIEINLRKGGTTHPFLTLQFLTDGTYDPAQGVFRAPGGQLKSFVASDHVEFDVLRGFSADDLFEVAVETGLHFNQGTQTGVVFHMMSALGEWGRVGLTAVADSADAAEELYERAIATLQDEASWAPRESVR